MRLCYLIALLIFSLPKGTYSQHLLLFEKYTNSYAQWYFETPDFPKQQIQEKYKEGYEIIASNFKQKRWFIAMRKNQFQSQQQYFTNPTSEQLDAKISDGFSIVDFCYYYHPYDHKINSFYVLNKTSASATKGFYTKVEVISNNVSYQDYSIYLVGMIHSATLNNLRIQALRTYGHPVHSSLMLGYIYSKEVINPPASVWAVRPDYPTDFINNKISENYKIKSVVYSTYDKKWVVIMEENRDKIPWKLVNYNNKDELKKAFDEKYTLVNVF